MITRYRVSLDRQSLDAIAPEIMILDVACTSPPFSLVSSTLAGRNGQIVHRRTVPSCAVTVTFEIHTQDINRRQTVCMQVQEWAMRGGILRTNSRPHQRLRVICDRPPVITSELKWTEKLTIGFTAYEIPYWEDENESIAVVAAGEEKTLFVQGSTKWVPVSADIPNTSGQTVNTLTISAGDTVFSFDGLGLASGETLSIGYDDAGLLYIRAGDVSKMDKRTPESSDELRIPVGQHAPVSVTADAAVTATFKARGRHM